MESQDRHDKNKYIFFLRFLSKLVTTMLSFLSWERFTDYSLVKSREGTPFAVRGSWAALPNAGFLNPDPSFSMSVSVSRFFLKKKTLKM